MNQVPTETFRNSTYPWGGGFLILCLLGLNLAFLHSKPLVVGVLLTPLVWLAIFITYRAYIRAIVIADQEYLIIRNPFKDYRVSWFDIDEILPRSNLVVTVKSGKCIKIWCVQRANISMLRGTRSFMDDVAEDLEYIRMARKAE